MLIDGVEVASAEVDEVEVEVEIKVEELVVLDEEVEVREAVVDEPPAVPLGAFGRGIYPNRPFLVFPQLSEP